MRRMLCLVLGHDWNLWQSLVPGEWEIVCERCGVVADRTQKGSFR